VQPDNQSMATERFTELAQTIKALPESKATAIVGIDGAGGAGKSAFASRLAKTMDEAPILHTDDFASWEEPIDWDKRFRKEALERQHSASESVVAPAPPQRRR
jgi:ABC-type enterochelin transport system ATPase subunit